MTGLLIVAGCIITFMAGVIVGIILDLRERDGETG